MSFHLIDPTSAFNTCYMAVSTYDVDASRVHHPAMAGIDYACLERLRLKYLLVAWRAWIRDINLLAFPRGTRLGICLGIILTLAMTGRKISITDVLMIKYNVYTVIKCTECCQQQASFLASPSLLQDILPVPL